MWNRNKTVETMWHMDMQQLQSTKQQQLRRMQARLIKGSEVRLSVRTRGLNRLLIHVCLIVCRANTTTINSSNTPPSLPPMMCRTHDNHTTVPAKKLGQVGCDCCDLWPPAADQHQHKQTGCQYCITLYSFTQCKSWFCSITEIARLFYFTL